VSLTPDQVHENDAAKRIAEAAYGKGIAVADPCEGKANLKATVTGLLKVNRNALYQVNNIGNIALVSLHDNSSVQPGQLVAAAKIIPLVMQRTEVEKAEDICRRNAPVFEVKPLNHLKTGIIVTGSEVFYGRIQDRFGEVLKEKVNHYGGEFLDLQYVPDDSEVIFNLINGMIDKGADVVFISGGMAVDADDVTTQAISKAATEVVSYGVPLLPGAMCMIAYRRDVAILGIPACAMFNKTTILDVIYPRVLAGERLVKQDLISLAHGGICLQCEECRYPACSFGK
jgi:molybdenum cofactor synthesis domain-containing protein